MIVFEQYLKESLLRQRLRDIELASTSHIHSNRDVYLQRIRKYAVKLSISHDFCKMGVL